MRNIFTKIIGLLMLMSSPLAFAGANAGFTLHNRTNSPVTFTIVQAQCMYDDLVGRSWVVAPGENKSMDMIIRSKSSSSGGDICATDPSWFIIAADDPRIAGGHKPALKIDLSTHYVFPASSENKIRTIALDQFSELYDVSGLAANTNFWEYDYGGTRIFEVNYHSCRARNDDACKAHKF